MDYTAMSDTKLLKLEKKLIKEIEAQLREVRPPGGDENKLAYLLEITREITLRENQ